MGEKFERDRQPWKVKELPKLRHPTAKGRGLKGIAKTLDRSKGSTRERARVGGIAIVKPR